MLPVLKSFIQRRLKVIDFSVNNLSELFEETGHKLVPINTLLPFDIGGLAVPV